MAFERCGREDRFALGDVLGGEGDGLVRFQHAFAGAERGLVRGAGLGLGDDATPHVFAESERIGANAPTRLAPLAFVR